MIRSIASAVLLLSIVSSSTAFASVLTAKHSGKVLDVPGFNPMLGVGIVQWNDNGALAFNQWFDVRDKGNGYYEIASSLTRQCLDAAFESTGNGAPIVQWPCHGRNNQLWRLDRQTDGYVRFINKHSEKCMTVNGASHENGAVLVQFDFHDSLEVSRTPNTTVPGRPSQQLQGSHATSGPVPRRSAAKLALRRAVVGATAESSREGAQASPLNPSADDLMSRLLSGNFGTKSESRAADRGEPAGVALPHEPRSDDVLSALKLVAPKVAACADGQKGIAIARIEVAGTTGRVKQVNVSGQFAGTVIGSCVAEKVAKARFPRFASSAFSVVFPFKF